MLVVVAFLKNNLKCRKLPWAVGHWPPTNLW